MLDIQGLLTKHRGKGVFVDANLLVLWLVGSVNLQRIRNFKRTGDFTVEDHKLLSALIQWFGTPLLATPHVLSQVSDLTDLSGPEGKLVRERLKSVILTEVVETYDSARQLVNHPLFARFGLGDASVAAICERGVVVLTADAQLQVALSYKGLDAINFTHLRPLGWS